jgi:RES domain-containing protein
MMSLPWESGPTLAWRLDTAAHAPTWDRGVGALKVGGRWNPQGVAAVYCSLDPATAIIEVAVHKGFDTLDRVGHVFSWCRISEPATLHVVRAAEVPNARWLQNGLPSHAQQKFGQDLLQQHGAFVVPSAVCNYSWNLIFSPSAFKSRYALETQSPLSLDTRLNPP